MNDIVLGRQEEYDAAELDCWSFLDAADVRDGLLINFGNLRRGYPFMMCGHEFALSESAYLCGEFSLNTEICSAIQGELLKAKYGYVAKQIIKMRNVEHVRPDWDEIRLQWMFYVVWQKCRGNEDFARMLCALPEDAVIIEDSTRYSDETCDFWGARNEELWAVRRERAESVRLSHPEMGEDELKALVKLEVNRINRLGIWRGGNNLGKVLKLCQLALLHGNEPPIDYALLRGKDMYLLGERLTF